MTTTEIRLTAEGRSALRKAITNHDNWTSAFRNKHSMSLATMSRGDYFRAAELLGIDAAAIVRSATSQKTDAARAAFDRIATNSRETGKTELQRAVEADKAMMARRETKTINHNEDEFHARESAHIGVDYARVENEHKANFKAAEKAARDTANTDDNAKAANQLAALIAQLATSTVDENTVREIVAAEIDKALQEHSGQKITRIELTENGISVGKIDGFQHPEFSKLLRSASARAADGYAPNVWIAGPAGSGKTYAVGQVARALDVPFHYNGAIGMPHELLGFIDAGGTYHRTAFREAYENGGCYLFDEVDGSDNSALLALNAALANGSATFPDKVVKRHKDCRIFAAANTWGMGATAEYVGRAKLDAAFLSRFPVRITWNYDDRLEQDICGNVDFARMVQKARAAAANIGLKVLITPRDSMAGAALVANGFTLIEAAEMTYLASLSNEQKEMLARN